ncbi:uncharacterized protein SOCE26_091250 [Sorangium cellulosum]|uniref:Uncharacterized protein n=1 Tax=Sorangium cellulosum TaxID=56 RepID=A0A2L0F7U1_SORCE|nr:uncharacterized protein SOCE26_091250 [Sorangium cellulosum]
MRARRAGARRAPCCRGAERGGVAGAAGDRRPRVSAAADRDHAGRDGVLRRGARGALSVRAKITHSPSQSPRAVRRTNRCGFARSGSGGPRRHREAAARRLGRERGPCGAAPPARLGIQEHVVGAKGKKGQYGVYRA